MNNKRIILLIDEEANIGRSTAAIFRQAGYDVAIAKNGPEAMEMIKTQSYHLAVLNMAEPDFLGLYLLKTLHKAAPGLPLLVLSCTPMSKAVESARRMGASAYLVKPLDPAIILDCISQLIEGTRESLPNQSACVQILKSGQ